MKIFCVLLFSILPLSAATPRVTVTSITSNQVVRLVTVTNGNMPVFAIRPALGSGVAFRGIQNVGTSAVMVAIGTTNVATTNAFAVIQGGTVVWDGKGGRIDLSMFSTNVLIGMKASNDCQVIITEILVP